jgi:hypothetical protein
MRKIEKEEQESRVRRTVSSHETFPMKFLALNSGLDANGNIQKENRRQRTEQKAD